MKKQLLVLTLFLLGLIQIAVQAQCTGNVNIPDANFKAVLVADTTINTDNDTEISCAEALAFTGVLDVSVKSISDLTGIEAFVNISGLFCYNNTLTSLDVSNNTGLEVLVCDNNTLTSLDISNNPDLKILYCSDNTLTSIDVSNNTDLIGLYCSDNTLTSLDISNNPDLIELYCSDNALTSLDISNNPDLEKLYCSNNALTSLDIFNNPDLKELSCTDNALTSLNMANGNNTNLSVFNASGNTNLSCIQVDDVAYSTTQWSDDIDNTASFSNNCSSLSVLDNEFNAISLYPNPVLNTLNISLSTLNKAEKVQVYNLLGKKVLETTNTTIDISYLS
ncbi:T9SS type A sorting domain-containing protein, partial [Flavivirga aquimarina]